MRRLDRWRTVLRYKLAEGNTLAAVWVDSQGATSRLRRHLTHLFEIHLMNHVRVFFCDDQLARIRVHADFLHRHLLARPKTTLLLRRIEKKCRR